MTEKKKTENRLRKRVTYETPRVWCFPIEAEGIMAGSGTVGFTGGTGVGNNTIHGQTGNDFFGSTVGIGTGTIGGQGGDGGGIGGSSSGYGTTGQTGDSFFD